MAQASRASKMLIYKKKGLYPEMTKGFKISPGKKKAPKKSYSAKAASKGKDIGKPGKQFAKIANSAGKKYGSKKAGQRVAGAILARLRGGK